MSSAKALATNPTLALELSIRPATAFLPPPIPAPGVGVGLATALKPGPLALTAVGLGIGLFIDTGFDSTTVEEEIIELPPYSVQQYRIDGVILDNVSGNQSLLFLGNGWTETPVFFYIDPHPTIANRKQLVLEGPQISSEADGCVEFKQDKYAQRYRFTCIDLVTTLDVVTICNKPRTKTVEITKSTYKGLPDQNFGPAIAPPLRVPSFPDTAPGETEPQDPDFPPFWPKPFPIPVVVPDPPDPDEEDPDEPDAPPIPDAPPVPDPDAPPVPDPDPSPVPDPDPSRVPDPGLPPVPDPDFPPVPDPGVPPVPDPSPAPVPDPNPDKNPGPEFPEVPQEDPPQLDPLPPIIPDPGIGDIPDPTPDPLPDPTPDPIPDTTPGTTPRPELPPVPDPDAQPVPDPDAPPVPVPDPPPLPGPNPPDKEDPTPPNDPSPDPEDDDKQDDPILPELPPVPDTRPVPDTDTPPLPDPSPPSPAEPPPVPVPIDPENPPELPPETPPDPAPFNPPPPIPPFDPPSDPPPILEEDTQTETDPELDDKCPPCPPCDPPDPCPPIDLEPILDSLKSLEDILSPLLEWDKFDQVNSQGWDCSLQEDQQPDPQPAPPLPARLPRIPFIPESAPDQPPYCPVVNINSITGRINELKNKFKDVVRLLTELEPLTVIKGSCEENQWNEEEIVINVPLILSEVVEQSFDRLRNLQRKACEDLAIATIPEWWSARVNADRPQLVITFAKEIEPGKVDRRIRSVLTIPHYSGPLPLTESPVGSHTRGPIFGEVTLDDNSKIRVFAENEEIAKSVISEALAVTDGSKVIDPEPSIKKVEREGLYQKIKVVPIRAAYYPTGQLDNENPQVFIFE